MSKATNIKLKSQLRYQSYLGKNKKIFLSGNEF